MIFTDTHTHLYSEKFDEDRFEMIDRAIEAGVSRFFLPAIDSSYTKAMFDLQERYPEHIYVMTGLHPVHVKDDYKKELDHVAEVLSNKKVVAIGEIGMDLYWEKKYVEEQKITFSQQIKWSLEHDLPIVIHCRDAFDEVFEVLGDFKETALKGIFHCFTGTLDHAHKAIDLGLSLGIGGVATFKNGKIDTFLNQIDLGNIVLETDAPYLSPVPYRGKRNESAYLPLIGKKVAEIYKIPLEEVARVTTLNSKQIFGV